MNPRFYILFIAMVYMCNSSIAQNNIRFENIGVKEGLSFPEVRCIFQDSKGFIWIGTRMGLNRFDGISFKKWFSNNNDANSLVHNDVLTLAEDKQHRIWIGTQEGVSCFNVEQNTFINYSIHEKGNRYMDAEFCQVYNDKEGNIWLGMKGVMYKFNEVTKVFTKILAVKGIGGLKGFLHDSKNRLWMSLNTNVICMEGRSIRYVSKPSTMVKAYSEDAAGNIYLASWNGGIARYDEGKKAFVQLKGSAETGLNVSLSFLPQHTNGVSQMWICTYGSLCIINTTDLLNERYNYRQYNNDPNDVNSIGYGIKSCIIKDRSGNIWIATEKGVSKVNANDLAYHLISTGTDSKGIKWYTNSMCGDFFNKDSYWISTGHSLCRFNRKTNKIIINAEPTINAEKLYIWNIYKGKTNYWLANDMGVIKCSNKMKILKQFQYPVNKTVLQKITRIFEDSGGNIWIAIHRKGIARINPGTGKIEWSYCDSSLQGRLVHCFTEDKHKNVWIGTEAGIYVHDYASQSMQHYRSAINRKNLLLGIDIINAIYKDKSDTTWVATRQGFGYFDKTQKKVMIISFPSDEWSTNISGIAKDKAGAFWLGSSSGLIRYEPSLKRFKKFFSQTTIPDNDFSEMLQSDDDGNIYGGLFGTFLYFNPATIAANNFSPPVIITEARINNQLVQIQNDRLPEIQYNESLSLDFVSLNYTDAAQNQYACKLDGIEEDWVMLGSNRNLRYFNLPTGKHTIQLKASNNEGVWSKETTITLFVAPPFWETWWFITLGAVIVFGIFYTFYRYRLNAAIKLERLRLKLASDLHDDIGATLSSISMYSQAVKMQVKDKLPHLETVLNKMGESSRRMVSNMSDIVWAIDPENDEGSNLTERIESYAAEHCALQNLWFHFRADDVIKQLHLPLEYRKNIYLIFKESLNNSLKYAEAKNIWIAMEYADHRLKLILKDDGKGFMPTQNFEGNGLRNIHIRAKEINGNAEINSMPGNGTTITLTCKIT